MSRQSIKELLRERSDKYRRASQEKRHLILIEIRETTGFSRKHLINLLNGNIAYRERKGRGKGFGESVRKVLKAVWLEAGSSFVSTSGCGM